MEMYNIAKDLLGKIPNKIDDLLMFCINVDDVVTRAADVIQKVFFNMPERIDVYQSSDIEGDCSFEYRANILDDMSNPRLTFYKNTPIWLYSTTVKKEGRRWSYESPKFFMKTIGTKKNIKNLKEFLTKLTHKGVNESKNQWNQWCYVHKNNNNYCAPYSNLRTFNGVFIPKEQEELLKYSVDNFINRRKWYLDNGIPYHYGILLYGDPGTGKSVIAQAITKYMGARPHFIYGDDVLRLPEMLGSDIPSDTMSEDKYHAVIIEDVDCGFITEKESESEKKDDNSNERKSKMAGLLNSLDGISAPTNTIYILTTNHIDKLDPALIRPGRIDIKLEIKGVCKETFDQFCMKHFNRTYDEDIDFKQGLTFAYLQNEVMNGKSLEEIVEISRKPKRRKKNENTES